MSKNDVFPFFQSFLSFSSEMNGMAQLNKLEMCSLTFGKPFINTEKCVLVFRKLNYSHLEKGMV